MLKTKNIIIVAPEIYSGIARKLAHQISKKKNLNSTFWSIAHYKNNESQMSFSQNVIFVGNPEENELSKDFSEIINEIKNEAGVCYGFDGNKAIVYGEGKLHQIEDAYASANTIKVGGFLTVGSNIASSLFLYTLPFLISMMVYKFFSEKKKKEKLLKNQTKLAITNFLIKDFDIWLGISPEGTTVSK
jgi:hypothetical protein